MKDPSNPIFEPKCHIGHAALLIESELTPEAVWQVWNVTGNVTSHEGFKMIYVHVIMRQVYQCNEQSQMYQSLL